MTDLPAVRSDKKQEVLNSRITYEQALADYESEMISRCPGCWGGCPDCLSPCPAPPNPEDYLDKGEK